jgi:hypothetical protein
MAIWDESGIPVRVAGSITDITEQRLLMKKTRLLIMIHDRTAEQALLTDSHYAAASAQRRFRKVAGCFLTRTNFKAINGTIRPSYGDQLLMKVENS